MSEDVLPSAYSIVRVMERTVQLVGANAPRQTLKKVAEVLHTLRWDFQDCGAQVYFLVNDAGDVDCATENPGTVDAVITMDAATLHDAAVGQGNLGVALLTGKLRLEGISAMNLSRFSGLLNPLLSSYRQAFTELNEPGR